MQCFLKKHFCHIEPNARYTNTCCSDTSRSVSAKVKDTDTVSNAKLAVHRNVFALIVATDDYEEDMYLQTHLATYREIQAWVKEHYGLHVSNLAISQVKERCGLAKTEYKGYADSERPNSPKLRPDKEAAIRKAFVWFGLLKE